MFYHFAELKAIVLGTADLYVKTGSDINLTCKISKGPHELGTVFWYKGKNSIEIHNKHIPLGEKIFEYFKEIFRLHINE